MIGRNDNAGPQGDGINEEVCFTQNTIDRHAVAQPISIQDVRPVEKAQNGKGWNDDGTAYTVDTHATQGVAQPIAFEPGKMKRLGYGDAEPGLAPTLRAEAGDNQLSVAWSMNLMSPGRQIREDDGVGALTQDAHRPTQGNEAVVIQQAMAVRKLTPVECERLQGFPDNYSNIPWRKAAESPDGPRYKALGNSWAVPVVAWIGQRIQNQLK
jgi:DNA (cytosine-5)-methyltransferase 1